MLYLSHNPNAIHIIKDNFKKINWTALSANQNAINILENNLDKINWSLLSTNLMLLILKII